MNPGVRAVEVTTQEHTLKANPVLVVEPRPVFKLRIKCNRRWQRWMKLNTESLPGYLVCIRLLVVECRPKVFRIFG
jgi:hypothetical protein